jgi:uncharacterized protein
MAIFLVLGFPLITGLGYSCAYLIARVMAHGAEPKGFDRVAPLLYPVFLLVPLAGVLWARPAALTWERLGAVAPRIGTLSPLTALLVALGVGAATGLALFLNERAAQRRAARRGKIAANRPRTEGRGLITLFVLMSVVVVVIEELAWRGFLINAMADRWGWGPWVAAAVAAVAFGSIHYFFGLRDIAFKTVSGLLWGALFLGTGSLLAPLVSHLVFDLLVWTPLNEI